MSRGTSDIPMERNIFYQMYAAAHDNAVRLLKEAEILFKQGDYARAYFLAFTGLEEIAKSQLAADVFTGFIEERAFWAYFKSHDKKIGRMQWASLDAEEYLDVEQETYLDIEHPTTAERMDALYVHFDQGRVVFPMDQFKEDKARAIIHTLRVAIDRIIETTEHWGHQIGTKGFMK